jgi:4-amino-4-deoxy-L-arabinose transferase-like glycosyltransferase
LISRRIAAWLGAALVVVAFGLPLFIDLGATDFKGDEPIYAFAIDRMLDRGDWLTPKAIPSDDTAFLEKPPLKFWIVAASVRAGLLPQNDFGYRVWDVLFGIGAFLYVYALGLRMAGIVCGLTAVLVLFGHEPLVLDHGLRSNNMEAALVLGYCGGMFHAISWEEARGRPRRWAHALLVAFWFAFGFMMKFVAAAFLPASLAVMMALSRRWRRRVLEDWIIWAGASVAAMLLVLPWFLYQLQLRGREFWGIIFGQHIFERFTAYLDPTHLHPWYFYLTTMWAELSWSHSAILVCIGLVLLAHKAIRQRSDAAALMLVWFLLPLAAISSGTSKLYHYVFPFLPPLAIGVGLLPMAVVNTAERHKARITQGLERLWPPSIAARMPPWLRTALFTLAIAAIALAVITPIVGSVTIRIAGTTILRNSTTSRPLIAATLLLMAAGFFRYVPVALVAVLLLVVLPFDAYRNVRTLEVAQANYDRAPMRMLRDCLLRVQAQGAPSGVYVYTHDTGQWKYAYYLREPGWDSTDAGSPDKLRRRLLFEGEERPVFLQKTEYDKFRSATAADPARRADLARLDNIRHIVWDDQWMMLLPGAYAPCASVQGGSVIANQ